MADKRVTHARPDLAAAHLKGYVKAALYGEGWTSNVIKGRASLRAAPSDEASQDSELLFGETVTVLEDKDNWSWVQAEKDHYVGYVRTNSLGNSMAATLRVAAISTPVFSMSDLKAPVCDLLPLNAEVPVLSRSGDYIQIAKGFFVHYRHLVPVDEFATDFVSVAERFLGAPYVWGGKTIAGLDCSGLIQTALQASGIAAPRDTDMMEKILGLAVDREQIQRGDLIFWKGHMGVMLDASRLLHANAFHMEVFAEPLDQAIARIEKTAGPVTSIKRL